MSLFNKKAHQDDQIDRISDLPSNVIDGILEHLEIRDVVRTGILSTKWRYMWTSVPTLWFEEEFFDEYEHLVDPSPVVSKIITDVLMRHNGPIYHFSLFIPPEYNFKITMEHLDTWVPLLSRRGIKYLELANHGTHLDQMPYIDLSCKELTYFKFASFNLSIPPNFSGFKRLLKLHLISVTSESSALESLISGCPLLEKINIEYCNGFEYFDFSAPSLKILSLNFDENVESICLKKAKNLIDLTLIAAEGWVSGLIKSLPKNMHRFSIGSNYNNEILYADTIPASLLKSSFNSIKYLKLDDVNLNERRELLYIVSVLKSAPCLVELVLESFNLVYITQVSDRSEELECSRCCLHRLQTVNIDIIYSTQHAMSLIRFILANSTSLETLTFKVGFGSSKLDAPMLASISQDLLWMERASPRAHVKFLPSL